MDPQTTLIDLFDAIERRDWERVRELSDALLGWMERGGFPPEVAGPGTLGKRWHQTMATFVCHAAVARANEAARRRQKGGTDAAH